MFQQRSATIPDPLHARVPGAGGREGSTKPLRRWVECSLRKTGVWRALPWEKQGAPS